MTEDKIKKLLEQELVLLWNDLHLQLRMAQNGYWSIGVEGCLRRILIISRVIGMTSWERVPYSILSSGIYTAVGQKIQAVYTFTPGDVMSKPYPQIWSFTVGHIDRYDLQHNDEL